MVVNGDEELAAFCVEDGGDFIYGQRSWRRGFGDSGVRFEEFPGVCVGGCYDFGYVGGDDIKGVDSDDLCGVCEVHCLGDSNGDSQSGEASGPDGDIDVVDLLRFSAEAVHQAGNGGEYLGAVSHRAGKAGFGEQIFATGQCYGAYSAGCFKCQYEGVICHILRCKSAWSAVSVQKPCFGPKKGGFLRSFFKVFLDFFVE